MFCGGCIALLLVGFATARPANLEANDAVDDAVKAFQEWVAGSEQRDNLEELLKEIDSAAKLNLIGGALIPLSLYGDGTPQDKFNQTLDKLGGFEEVAAALLKVTHGSTYISQVASAVGSDFSVDTIAKAVADATTKENIQDLYNHVKDLLAPFDDLPRDQSVSRLHLYQ